MALNSDDKIPKYIKIRQWILSMIKLGRIEVGDKLPTEEELAKKFGVNRMTVRQALDELVIEKMIRRRRGEGTVLIAKKPNRFLYGLENISSFNDDMESHGITPIHEMQSMEVLPCDEEIAQLLDIKVNTKVIQTISVKRVETEAVLIEKSFIPYKEFKEILNMKVDVSFYHLLVEKFGVQLDHSTQIFKAAMPGDYEQQVFNMPNPEPCMLLESVIYDTMDIPIEVLFSYYRGDRYRFKVNSGEYLFTPNSEIV